MVDMTVLDAQSLLTYLKAHFIILLKKSSVCTKLEPFIRIDPTFLRGNTEPLSDFGQQIDFKYILYSNNNMKTKITYIYIYIHIYIY